MRCMRWAGSIGGICSAMFSFEKYRRHYILQFFYDVCIIGFLALLALFTIWNFQRWADKYWIWIVFALFIYGIFRCITLFIWLVKSLLIRNSRLIFITFTSLLLFVSLLFAMLNISMLGIYGITPDGTEHRY